MTELELTSINYQMGNQNLKNLQKRNMNMIKKAIVLRRD